MSFFLKLRKFARLRFYFIIAVIGLLFAVGTTIGIVIENKTTWIDTTAEIVSIEPETVGDDTSYDVEVTYKDNNGSVYTEPAHSYDPSMRVGQTISIQYDQSNPSLVRVPSSNWVLYAGLAIGAVAFVGGTVMCIVEARKPLEAENQFNRVKADNNNETANEEAVPVGEEKEYIFHMTGKFGFSFIMETKDRVKVYEATCDKNGIVSKSQFTFINHVTQHQEQFEVSHTVSTEYEGENSLLTLDYHFKVNGENCWDHLGNMGYSLEPHLLSMTKAGFDVIKRGTKVAYFEMAGTNDAPGAKQYPWGNMPSTVVLKVRTYDCDLDGVFFACFCIARK